MLAAYGYTYYKLNNIEKDFDRDINQMRQETQQVSDHLDSLLIEVEKKESQKYK